jgi:AraC-like DNA-binding protein
LPVIGTQPADERQLKTEASYTELLDDPPKVTGKPHVVLAKPKGQSGLYDPRRGDRALRVRDVALRRGVSEPARTNCFAVYWIEQGSGTFSADDGHHSFGPDSLLFFTPYQYVRFDVREAVRGTVIEFHANFLCVETFHSEVGCSSVLFNDPYGVPAVTLDGPVREEIAALIERIRDEHRHQALAFGEVLVAYTKILLVLASRRKLPESETCPGGTLDYRHPVLEELREAIEAHYRSLHAPADYARLLHMTPKTLGRIVRQHLGKTLSALIQERILIHAKWQLLHTLRPVKEIARELGFDDELYFSRLFKKATGYSPKFFREFETEIRGGSNLSMPLGPSSIQASGTASDNSG